MTLGLVLPPSGYTVGESWQGSAKYIHFLPSQSRKIVFVWRLLLVSGFCFLWPSFVQHRSACQGWVGPTVCLRKL